MDISILNTENDVSNATGDIAYTKDRTKFFSKQGDGYAEVESLEGIPYFDYRFQHGNPEEAPQGYRDELTPDGLVKRLFTHNADHQTERDVEFIGFN